PVNFFINARNKVNATLTRIHSGNFDSSLSVQLLPNSNISINQTLSVPQNKPLSQPYWLVHPKEVGIFDIRDQELIGKAQNDPAFPTTYTISIQGVDFNIDRPVQYKVVDPAKGELYEPVAVIPREEINFTRENYVSLNGASVTVPVQLKANDGKDEKEVVKVSDAHLFKNQTGSQSLTLVPGQQAAFVFAPVSTSDSYKEEISLTPESDAVFGGSTRVIAYDHIPTITYFTPAKANLIHLSVITKGKKVGYIAGAGDKVPEALEQLGYEVTLLSEADLTTENLKQFDAIVTGIRASNIFEYLTDKNEVLNEYVKNGGNLIAQYIKSNNVGSKRLHLGPYPFTISTGSRVTEENAAVHFALPDHPVLHYPNQITEKDFEGWVQERSTYQVLQSDPHFEMPLTMHDTGEKDSNGSLAIAKYGKGNFAYVSLVLFRQLPAGVPGAFRILANLLALPKNP
ncbi:MAG: PIG-L family deacetylase, partial [Bacteroidota bacterium]|nr:PIG-L family deacetylase [Bacteroidota bacterium]